MGQQKDIRPGDLDLAGVLDGRYAFIGPEQVVIDLTNKCNNNCIGCWTRSPLLGDRQPPLWWQEQELAFDRILDLINDLADLGTRRIRFTGGGEPFLHPRLEAILRACKKRGLITCITTNGTLLTPEWIELITTLPLDELAISLWAASPETYSKTHPNKTGRTFERIRSDIIALCKKRRLKPKVTLVNVLLCLNFFEAEQMYTLAREIGADAIYYTLLDPIEHRTDSLLIQAADVPPLNLLLDRVWEKNQALRAREKLELENWEGFRRRVNAMKSWSDSGFCGDYDASIIDDIPCYIGWIFCRILASGTMTPCCRGTQLPLGSILDGFKATWESEQYAEFRHKAKTLSKRDAYFSPLACHKTCDNLIHIETVHERLSQLSTTQRAELESYAAQIRKGQKTGQ